MGVIIRVTCLSEDFPQPADQTTRLHVSPRFKPFTYLLYIMKKKVKNDYSFFWSLKYMKSLSLGINFLTENTSRVHVISKTNTTLIFKIQIKKKVIALYNTFGSIKIVTEIHSVIPQSFVSHHSYQRQFKIHCNIYQKLCQK